MKIVGIFAIVNYNLTAVKFEGTEKNVFRQLFDNWQDPDYLYDFFEENKSDLQHDYYGQISVDDAVKCTIIEAEEMEAYIMKVANNPDTDQSGTLQHLIFKPLHQFNTSNLHLQSKAYGLTHPSWLRLYAVRIGPHHYVVSGGAIKLTAAMHGVSHLEEELRRLKVTQEYLKDIGLMEEDDFGYIEIMRHEE